MENYNFPSDPQVSYFIEQSNANDLSIIQCSYERCQKDKQIIGPTVYNHYTLHYVVSGKGRYETRNCVYHLQSGDVFVIFPSTIITYFPDPADPWAYCWIDFEGMKASNCLNRAGFTPDDPTFHCTDDSLSLLFSRAFETSAEYTSSNDLMISSYFYQIISYIIEQTATRVTYSKNEKERHILKAVKYIDSHYNDWKGISAVSVSRMLGLNVNYFSRLFKEIMGTPYSSYLVEIRLQKAIILFQQGIHTVKDVATAVGFNDPLYFCKVFKKNYGCTPREYAQMLDQQ